MPGAVIIGAGPGIGRAIAARFAREGMSVATIARSKPPQPYAALTLTADSTDETALRAALDAAAAELGPPDVVVYNAALIQADALGDLPAQALLDAWAVDVVGAITAAAHVLPGMAARRSGTFLITGGMPEPDPAYLSLSLGKAGIRTLVTMLDEQYRRSGVHVATVTVAGEVAPGTAFDPDDIADHYWRLHTQPRDRWERETVHA